MLTAKRIRRMTQIRTVYHLIEVTSLTSKVYFGPLGSWVHIQWSLYGWLVTTVLVLSKSCGILVEFRKI